MKQVIISALVLTALVAVLSLLLAASGMHRNNPIGANIAFLVPAILLNIGCIVWALRATAPGAGYLRQVGNGTLLGLVAGVLIFAFSMFMLTVLMPSYLGEVQESTIAWLQAQQIPDEVRAQQIEAIKNTGTVQNSLGGLIGTFSTSIVTSLVAAIFLRRKGAPG